MAKKQTATSKILVRLVIAIIFFLVAAAILKLLNII